MFNINNIHIPTKKKINTKFKRGKKVNNIIDNNNDIVKNNVIHENENNIGEQLLHLQEDRHRDTVAKKE